MNVRHRRHGRPARQPAVRHVRDARRAARDRDAGRRLARASTSSASRTTPSATTRSSGTANGRSPTRPFATWASPTPSGSCSSICWWSRSSARTCTPLIIMAPIPLTIIGVMPGHALLGAQYTATSMIGMIALAGHHRAQLDPAGRLHRPADPRRRRARGCGRALRRSRARKPIVLTGLAAMLGAFFILDDPIFNGLAISLIFGIFVSHRAHAGRDPGALLRGLSETASRREPHPRN